MFPGAAPQVLDRHSGCGGAEVSGICPCRVMRESHTAASSGLIALRVCACWPARRTGREREILVVHATLRKLAVLGAAGAMLAGCAEGTSFGGDPGPTPLAAGQSCGSIQQELNRMLGKGVQGSAERSAAGKPVSPAAKAELDRYNALLSQYLGARCHA